jgi:hypothetical protein
VHSPDLNPPYFYLWGYLKDNVHENNPQTIGELKAAITAKIREIPKEECVRVIANFARPTVHLDLFLCVVPMMSKTSSVLPHSAFTRLEPPYFYLWGYLKDNVYENNPQTIGELKAAITAKIREIP